MRVIFLQEVPKVSKRGEVKDISDGFARNFLFPRNLALPATPQAVKTHHTQLKAKAEREAKERAGFEKLAEQLKTLELSLKIKVGARGQAFGSITAQDLVEELAKQGIAIDKNWIELEQGIKTTGEHAIPVKLPFQILAEIRVIIESRGDKNPKS